MADLIDRNHLMNDICGDRCGMRFSECEKSKHCIFAQYIMSEESKEQKLQWIPCSERLPEQDERVIVCYFGSDLIMPMQGETVTEAIARIGKIPTVTMGFLSDDGWYGADYFPMMVHPQFWMPLPDPPERSEEE